MDRVLFLEVPAILRQHLVQRYAKRLHPQMTTAKKQARAATHQGPTFPRQVEDFDILSRGGWEWGHLVALFTPGSV